MDGKTGTNQPIDLAMHGNSKANSNLHHLCEIFKHLNRDTFKYGISDDPIEEEDGLSARAREQVEEMNLAAEYNKFGAEILLTDNPRQGGSTANRAYIY